jgi:hypothetical protein
MGSKGISVRALFAVSAVALAMSAIFVPGLHTHGTRRGSSTRANPAAGDAAANAAARQKAQGAVAGMPLYFEANRGQSAPGVAFLSHSGRYSLFLTDDATTVIAMTAGRVRKAPALATANPPMPRNPTHLVQSAVRIRMLGANPHPAITGLDPLPGRVNYLVGDKANFHTDIPTYARVKAANVYPGVDIINYGSHDSLEYDIVAAPGADTSKIRFAIEGPAKTSTDADGNILIATTAGVVVMRKPVIYQQNADGSRAPVAGSFELSRNGTVEHRVPRREVAIRLAAYDHSRTLVIDPGVPILVYSSLIGGSGASNAPLNLSGTLPYLNNADPVTESDMGMDLALDSSNNAYVTGIAFSTDFPTPNAFQTTLAGANSPPQQNPNVFVAKFNYTNAASSGASLVYATYLGGNGDTDPGDAGLGNGDLGSGIAVDGGNQPFIVGQTYSGTAVSGGPNFPGTAACGAFGQANQGLNSNTPQGFVTKLNNSGSAVVWSCYITGQNGATESRVALFPAACGSANHPQCKAYVVGSSQSSVAAGFPTGTQQPFQSALNTTAGSNASFLVVHEDGQSLDYATLYGGSGNGTNADTGAAVAIDASGNGYITGATFSTDLTTVNPAVSSFQGQSNANESNAYVAEFTPTLSGTASLVYATYLGGSGATGNIVAFNGTPISLSIGDAGTAITIDPATNDIWVAGLTASTDFAGIPGAAGATEGSAYDIDNQAGTGCDHGTNAPATAAFFLQIDTTKQTQSQILYSTYFGGCGVTISIPDPYNPIPGKPQIIKTLGIGDAASDIAIVGGKVFITGTTTGGELDAFPLSANVAACTTPYILAANRTTGFNFDGLAPIPLTAFVAEFDPTQQNPSDQLLFSTLLGGSGELDASTGMQVDSDGNIVVTGFTFSPDFPLTANGFQITNKGVAHNTTNGFLTVLNPNGTTCPTALPTPTPAPTRTPTGPAAIFVNPPSHAFYLTATHLTTVTTTFTITNTGWSVLKGTLGKGTKVLGITSGSGKYSLAPQATLTATITFVAPKKPGKTTVTISLTSNAKHSTLIPLHLYGTST